MQSNGIPVFRLRLTNVFPLRSSFKYVHINERSFLADAGLCALCAVYKVTFSLVSNKLCLIR